MKINVPHIAKLANLTLTDEEIQMFAGQLSEVLDYVNKLSEVDTSTVEETSQITGLENVLREDIVSPSLSQAEALQNTTKQQNGMFKVNGILEE